MSFGSRLQASSAFVTASKPLAWADIDGNLRSRLVLTRLKGLFTSLCKLSGLPSLPTSRPLACTRQVCLIKCVCDNTEDR